MIQEYLFKTLTYRWTRLLVTFIILALLAYQLSIVFWQFYPSPVMGQNEFRSQVIANRTIATPQQSYIERAQAISRAYLFGKSKIESAPVLEKEEAPETRLNYKLRGIFFSPVERLSSAIVETKINDSKFYRLDDELADGITLGAIERDHILINRYGKVERLNLEKSTAAGTGDAAISRSNYSNALANTALLRRYKKRYVSNPMALAQRFAVIPVMENGRNIGFKLKALRGESLLKKLNFQDSDIFTKVNGIGLDKPFQALDALKSLTTAPSASVTILRNGNEETLDFSLQ